MAGGLPLGPEERNVLKIANWNLERVRPSQRRSTALGEHIAAVMADIWILTETHELVGPGDGFSSCFSGDPDRDSSPGERWVGIWSRFPIEPLPSFVSDSPRCAAVRIPDSPLGEIVVYGGVLPWTTEWHGIPGIDGQAFDAALSVQRDDWKRLQRQFPDATLIVGGDFNQDLAATHYYGSKKKRRFLESALRDTGLAALTSGTDDPIARESPPCASIDHICVSKSADWRLDRTTRWPDSPAPLPGLSDHFGVAVEVSRP